LDAKFGGGVMRYLSLFSGQGGFDLGLDAAGMTCVGQCEIDPAALKVLAHHWPNVPRWTDVRDLRGADIPFAEIVTFGSPCQDLSVAGKRAGFDGARSGLFFEATRIISEMREASNGQFPRIAIWENVPGAQSSANGRDFGAALDALAESGAVDIAWRIINAEHWLPQRRRRVFVVALYPPFATGDVGIGRAAEILSLGHSVLRHPAKGGKAGQDLATAAARSIDVRNLRDGEEISGTLQAKNNGSYSLNYTNPVFVPEVATTVNANYAKGTGHNSQDENVVAYVPDTSPAVTSKWAKGSGGPSGDEVQNMVALSFQERGRDGGKSLEHQEELAYSLNAGAGGGRTNERNVAYAIQDAAGPINKQQGGVGISKEDGPMYTLDSRGQHGVVAPFGLAQITSWANQQWIEDGRPAPTLHQAGGAHVMTRWAVRRLTPTECLALQGFPRTWFDGLGLADSAKYRLCGNAVAVPVIRWLGEQIMRCA
jgi:DNA (cytosine-5)-methyltransferase 1